MIVNDGEFDYEYNNVELIQQEQYGNEWYLAFRELTEYELHEMELNSKIEYLAMMTGIDMEV